MRATTRGIRLPVVTRAKTRAHRSVRRATSAGRASIHSRMQYAIFLRCSRAHACSRSASVRKVARRPWCVERTPWPTRAAARSEAPTRRVQRWPPSAWASGCAVVAGDSRQRAETCTETLVRLPAPIVRRRRRVGRGHGAQTSERIGARERVCVRNVTLEPPASMPSTRSVAAVEPFAGIATMPSSSFTTVAP